MPDFNSFPCNDISKILQYIQNMEAFTELDRYPPIRKIKRPSRINPKFMQQTSVKKNSASVPDITKQTNSPDSMYGFIQVETFDDSSNDNRGIHVLKSTCVPKATIVLSVNEMKRRFNGANNDQREDLSKHILAITLRETVEKGDFIGMLNLIDIDDCRIQSSVFSAIDIHQLETNLHGRCINGTEALRATKVLLDLCHRWSANHFLIVQLLPVILDTIAVLYLATCGNALNLTNFIPEVQTFAENSTATIERIIFVCEMSMENTTECSDLLVSLKKMMQDLRHAGSNPSPLRMVNFRDTLMNENSRCQLKKKFAKSMTYLEQYSLLFIVLNQIVRKSDIQIVVFLRDLIEILVEKGTKKSTQTIYALLKLTTKGIVHRLCRGESIQRTTAEYQLKLCNVLNLYINSAKIQQMLRMYLLELIQPLLFKESKELVKNAVLLFGKNNQLSKDIRRRVSEHIVKELSSINFKLEGVLKQSTKYGLEPSWMTFAGTISDDKPVVMFMLIPTLHCIAEGSMEDYKKKANKNETEKHLNTLDILKHLQDDKGHHNLIELIAFQCRPLPIFYISDKSVNFNLNNYLLDARKTFRWISNRELLTMAADAVDAISYLHSKHVVHRNLTTHAFSLRNKNIVLQDFSVANMVDNSTQFISDMENDDLPVLWSAPESILEDHYDYKTDIWMLGHFFYELFTHGCHPYTEVYRTPTEEILEYIVFQDLKLYKWPCIPKDVHEIITACEVTNSEERLDLPRIRKLLSNVLISFQGGKSKRVTQIFDEDKKYPALDEDNISPERGLPELFKQLKKNNTQDRNVIRKSYFNLRHSQRRPIQGIQITVSDIKAPDQSIVQEKFNSLAVYEPVTTDFVQSLPHLDKETCINVLHMFDSPSREERRNIPGNCQYLMKYRLQKSIKMFDVAFKRILGNPEENEDSYLEIVEQLVYFVLEMHKRNWILTDLCADNMYCVTDAKQVTMARLGRMLWHNFDAVLDDCIIDDIRKDRNRWLPIEILQNGQYSKEGDIYMLAMVIYEFYMALDIHNQDNMAGQLQCAPFANIPREKLIKTLYSGEVPMQPNLCPDWLYDIMKNCWDRDRTKRPSAKLIIEQMCARSTEYSHDGSDIYNSVDEYQELQETTGSTIGDENYDGLFNSMSNGPPTDNIDDEMDRDIISENSNYCSDSNSCPNIGIPRIGEVNPFSILPGLEHQFILKSRVASFRCVNSDTDSDRSSGQSLLSLPNTSVSDSSISTFNHFRCVNSISSESENEYQERYTDAKSISERYTNQTSNNLSDQAFQALPDFNQICSFNSSLSDQQYQALPYINEQHSNNQSLSDKHVQALRHKGEHNTDKPPLSDQQGPDLSDIAKENNDNSSLYVNSLCGMQFPSENDTDLKKTFDSSQTNLKIVAGNGLSSFDVPQPCVGNDNAYDYASNSSEDKTPNDGLLSSLDDSQSCVGNKNVYDYASNSSEDYSYKTPSEIVEMVRNRSNNEEYMYKDFDYDEAVKFQPPEDTYLEVYHV